VIAVRLLAPLLGFATSAVATGVIERLARRRGLLDQPDASRRTHTVPTPRLGGLGVAIGVAVALATLRAMGEPALLPATWLVGGLGFLAVGVADDLAPRGRGLSAGAKFALLASAATGAVLLGLRFDGQAFGPWPALAFGPATAALTVLWCLAVANVVNFMDGIDSITGTIVAILLAVATGAGPIALSPATGAGVGAVLGFLVWNAPRARIFLGDGGAYFLGFLVAAAPCRIEGSATVEDGAAALGSTPWPLVGAALVASIVDVVGALIHKGRSGVPLLQPHHDHLYQRLVKAGHPAAFVALRYGALTLAAAIIAGPLAARLGALAASAIGLAVLGAHLALGRRTVRLVPRLVRTGGPS
jgi:UDP-GlcNAc:undecaprenyl-phosphate GlcNAc-1-phosphate transferase